jgi:hypothetical protein
MLIDLAGMFSRSLHGCIHGGPEKLYRIETLQAPKLATVKNAG